MKEVLFNALYEKDVATRRSDIIGRRRSDTQEIRGLWQGTYDDYIEVIGDKSGAHTIKPYLKDKEMFLKTYEQLKLSLDIPILFLWPIRNPYDQIATYIYTSGMKKRLKDTPELLDRATNTVFNAHDTAEELIENVFGEENVLDVHNCDLVANPRGTISKLFEFLGIDIGEHYLDVCAKKIFKSESKSRTLVQWTPEQIEMVSKKIKDHKTLHRYSFTSD